MREIKYANVDLAGNAYLTVEPGKDTLRSWHLNWDSEVVEHSRHREEHCKALDGKEVGIFKKLKRSQCS